MDYTKIQATTTRDAILVTLTGPGRLNVISDETLEELRSLLATARADNPTSPIVITGDGSAFCAGADLKRLARFPNGATFGQHLRRFTDVLADLEAHTAPVIAAVNGAALGGGFELVLACDLVVAEPSAKFGVPEIHLGMLPGAGGTQRLPRKTPTAVARELLLLGETMSAERGWQLGLVNYLVDDSRAVEKSIEIASRISNGPAGAPSALKRLLRDSANRDLAQGIDLERETVQGLFETAEAQEGIAAFLEKRPPRFRQAPIDVLVTEHGDEA